MFTNTLINLDTSTSSVFNDFGFLKLTLQSFTFDFYLIYWEDIQSDSGWRDLKDIQDSKPAICVSTGWLVKKDAKVHIVMSDYNYNDKGEMGEGGNTTVIPTKNVITKYKIADL